MNFTVSAIHDGQLGGEFSYRKELLVVAATFLHEAHTMRSIDALALKALSREMARGVEQCG